eukprot:COSAG05_NODE_1362_length_5087_cov_50.062550_5_plen_173_part_00
MLMSEYLNSSFASSPSKITTPVPGLSTISADLGPQTNELTTAAATSISAETAAPIAPPALLATEGVEQTMVAPWVVPHALPPPDWTVVTTYCFLLLAVMHLPQPPTQSLSGGAVTFGGVKALGLTFCPPTVTSISADTTANKVPARVFRSTNKAQYRTIRYNAAVAMGNKGK